MMDVLSPFTSTASAEENTPNTTPPAESADTARNATDSEDMKSYSFGSMLPDVLVKGTIGSNGYE